MFHHCFILYEARQSFPSASFPHQNVKPAAYILFKNE